MAAQRRLDVIDTQKQQAQATLAQAVADRDLAQLNLGYTELSAPIDGTIGNRSARTGGYATIGAQLMSVVPARGLWVDANFKESQLGRMRPGLPASVEADVLPGQVFRGRVASLAPATGAQFNVLPPENATGNFTKIVQRVPVRIQLDDDAATLSRLRPGLSVTAAVDERPSANGGPRAQASKQYSSRQPPSFESSRRRQRLSPSRRCRSAFLLRSWTSRSSRHRCPISLAGYRLAPTKSPGCNPAT